MSVCLICGLPDGEHGRYCREDDLSGPLPPLSEECYPPLSVVLGDPDLYSTDAKTRTLAEWRALLRSIFGRRKARTNDSTSDRGRSDG